MLRALGNHLHDRDFPMTGALPQYLEPLMQPVGAVINALPARLREEVYTWSGRSEAVPARKLEQVRAEEVSRWMVSQYPRRRYPAVVVGSSNGALIHLCAALSIPWLPQTFLIPVRRSGVHPDEPGQEMEWGKEPGRALLNANPELQLHHMHDPNQDRLMVRRMAYFRVKRLRLGKTFERFLEENLEEGGTIFLAECGLRWPTTRLGERHVFQFGALGGATAEEFLRGSERVERYLARYGSHRRRWEAPEPDGERPEAEWGFEPELREDVERFARRRGYRVRRIVFEEPEQPSPLLAELYRDWYRERGMPAGRLLIESFILLEPHLTLRAGAVPFWMSFNTESSAAVVEQYLDGTEPYDHIHLMLFSHGVDSIGLVPARPLALHPGTSAKERSVSRSRGAEVPERFRHLRPLPPGPEENVHAPPGARTADAGQVQSFSGAGRGSLSGALDLRLAGSSMRVSRWSRSSAEEQCSR